MRRGFYSGVINSSEDQPLVRYHRDNVRMILMEDFFYVDSLGRTWAAHKGLVFDGKTVPRLLRWLKSVGSPYTGPSRRGAILHDCLVDLAKSMTTSTEYIRDRKLADWLYKDMAEYANAQDGGRSRWARVKSVFVQSKGVAIGTFTAWVKSKFKSLTKTSDKK